MPEMETGDRGRWRGPAQEEMDVGAEDGDQVQPGARCEKKEEMRSEASVGIDQSRDQGLLRGRR